MEAYSFVRHQRFAHLTDPQIVERILGGEAALFEVIMRRYNQRLFRIQRGYIDDESAVQDTLQTTYIKVYEKLHTFRGEASFATWIIRIAINEALLYLKKRKSHSRLHLYDDDDQKPEGQFNGPNPEEELIEGDMKQLLETAIDALPEDYRLVYVMREIEEMSTRDVAEAHQLTESNVKVRLMRAKEMLRDTLESSVKHTEVFEFLGERCDAIVQNVMTELNHRERAQKG